MINAITSINPVQFKQVQNHQTIPVQAPDTVSIENSCIDKKPLIARRIIKEGQDINEFFDAISAQVFKNSSAAPAFAKLLKGGYVALSSSCYEDIKTPYSSIGVRLNPKKLPFQNCAYLEQYIKDGVGVGINFNNFDDPIGQIKQINSYFKFREPNTLRPPAGIAILSLNHPKIMEFIKLKDEADYKDWCFDLSVIMDDKFLSLVDTKQNLKMSDGSEIPAKDIYDALLSSASTTGEPGVIFSNNPDYICDCCNATELQEGQGMTIAQINLGKFYNPKTGRCDCDYLKYASDLLVHAARNIDENAFIGVLGYQELLNKMGLKYGSNEANQVLEDCLTIIRMSKCKMALSPTGTTSRVLKTTPSIEPDKNNELTYVQEIDTMASAQKYLEGGISKTIQLKKGASQKDVDEIIRYSKKKNLKGITVFPF